MKLVAIQWIADQTPEGTKFELPDDESARILIAIGLAKQDTDEPEPARNRYRRRDLRADA